METNLNFGQALKLVQQGKKAQRSGWNGKGMFIAYSPGHPALSADGFWSPANKEYALSQEGGKVEVLPCLTMKTADNKILMGWLASQTDMLATDWQEA